MPTTLTNQVPEEKNSEEKNSHSLSKVTIQHHGEQKFFLGSLSEGA